MNRFRLLGLLALALLMAAFAGSVTIIPVDNPSFEDVSGSPPPFPDKCDGRGCTFRLDGHIPGWVGPTLSGLLRPSIGPTAPATFSSFAPGGGKISALSDEGTVAQTVGETVQEGLIYTLTVEIGHSRHHRFAGSADLLVGGTTFMARGTTPPQGEWSTFTATFTGTTANAGDPITIQLNSSGKDGNFDNVNLTATPVPEPGTLGMLGTGRIGLAGLARRTLKL